METKDLIEKKFEEILKRLFGLEGLILNRFFEPT